MSNIIIKRLGDIVNFKRGYDLPSYNRNDGPYPIVSSSGISGFHSEFKVEGEGLVTGRYGTLGEVYYINGKYWPHNTALYVTDFKKNYPKYVYFLMKCLGNLKTSDKSTVPGINRNDLHEIKIPYLKPEFQKGIADFLFLIDAKIELNNRINRELEQMAKLLYDYWFVQFDFPVTSENFSPNLGEMSAGQRGYKSSGGKMVWNKELKREIPEGWEVESLFKAMDVQYGFPFSTLKFTDEITDKPVIRIRDILENTISTYTNEDVDDKYRLLKNDLLIGMDGNFHLNFWDKEGAYLNQRSVRIRSKKDSLVSNLQAYFELTPYIKARENNISRTTVGHLSDKDLKRLYLISPPKSGKFKPKETFDSISAKIISNRLQNHQLATLRDWLLPMLMNGQVRVGEAGKKEYQPNEAEMDLAAEPGD